MDIFSSFATDADLETKGRWVQLSKTASVRVARAGNDEFNAYIRKELESAGVELGGTMDKATEEVVEGVILEATARHILKDWAGLTFRGKPVEYGPTMAAEMLKVKDFRRKIETLSRDFDGYKLREETALGND